MIKTCQNCFGWDNNKGCAVLTRKLPAYPGTCRFWKYTDDVNKDKIEHDILMYAGLRTKGGD